MGPMETAPPPGSPLPLGDRVLTGEMLVCAGSGDSSCAGGARQGAVEHQDRWVVVGGTPAYTKYRFPLPPQIPSPLGTQLELLRTLPPQPLMWLEMPLLGCEIGPLFASPPPRWGNHLTPISGLPHLTCSPSRPSPTPAHTWGTSPSIQSSPTPVNGLW